MPRPLRVDFPGALVHAHAQGNEKQSIFRDSRDRRRFLQILASVVEKYSVVCHAYCLMGNHYHLLLEMLQGNLSRAMEQLNGRYSRWFNWRYGRVGHLFRDRFKAHLVQKDSYLLTVSRYIVLNPVRSGVARSPEDWQWSSYRATAGLVPCPRFLTVDWLLGVFDDLDLRAAQSRYSEFVAAGEQSSEPLEPEWRPAIGDEEFVSEFQRRARKAAATRRVLRRERFLSRPTLEELFGAMNDMMERDLLMRKACEDHGYTRREVAGFLGLNDTSVSKAIQRCRARRTSS